MYVYIIYTYIYTYAALHTFKQQSFTNHQPEEFVWGILHLPLSIIAVTSQWGLGNFISFHQNKSIVITYNHHSIPIINHNHHYEPINTPWYRFGVYWNGDKNLWIFAGKSRPQIPHHPHLFPVGGRCRTSPEELLGLLLPPWGPARNPRRGPGPDVGPHGFRGALGLRPGIGREVGIQNATGGPRFFTGETWWEKWDVWFIDWSRCWK